MEVERWRVKGGGLEEWSGKTRERKEIDVKNERRWRKDKKKRQTRESEERKENDKNKEERKKRANGVHKMTYRMERESELINPYRN